MIIVLPRATEKAYRLIQEKNTYIFDVPLNANKQQIAEAVADQFDVKVSAVKTLVQQFDLAVAKIDIQVQQSVRIPKRHM